MKIEQVSLDRLIPYARNSRTHSDEQVAQVAASIREFGFTNPVLIDGEGGIIAGHGRVMAARKLGMDKVPCIRLSHLTEAQRRAYIIADNKLALNAGWDDAMLALEFKDLQDLGFDVELTGFGIGDIDELLAELDATPEGATDADETPPVQAEAVSKPGDVWMLGKHRIMCGDSTDSGSVARLMNGQTINLAFTSPPYASQRDYDASSGFKPIKAETYVEWFEQIQKNISANLAEDGSFFLNIKPASDGLSTQTYVLKLVLAHVENWGWNFATEFCWERNGIPGKPARRFKNQFEPIYQFTKNEWKFRPENVMHESSGVREYSPDNHWANGLKNSQGTTGNGWKNLPKKGFAYPGNRLPVFKSSGQDGHGAAFPVGLPTFFIKAYTDEGEKIFEPFSGSGTTIIAAEQTGRVCFAMELSPQYVDVAVRRWQNFTGKRAVHAETGREFGE